MGAGLPYGLGDWGRAVAVGEGFPLWVWGLGKGRAIRLMGSDLSKVTSQPLASQPQTSQPFMKAV